MVLNLGSDLVVNLGGLELDEYLEPSDPKHVATSALSHDHHREVVPY
jgi:hypothetical protein